MTKRQIRKTRTSGAVSGGVAAEHAAANDNALAAIFASIRDGEAPWRLDDLPADTGATAVLLHELDRLWQNPLN